VPLLDPWIYRQNPALELSQGMGFTLDGVGARRHRLGVETFAWTPWLPKGRWRPAPQPESSQELQAIRRTREWCG
jgi:hypothetical protein